MTAVITGPGLYDIPDDVPLRDVVPGGNGLSVSGAKKLLPPSCPAIYRYERTHPKPRSRAMDLGTVVHGLVLGTGQHVEVLDAPDWRKKAAQDWRDQVIADCGIPLLAHEWEQATQIADAVKQHDTTGPLFADGDAEQALFWRDTEFGIWKYGRLDWLAYFAMPTVADLKTARSAAPEDFAKACADFGYYMQDPYYRDGLAAILGCDWQDIDFMFAVVPTEPPYLPMVYRLKDRDTDLGRERNRIASEKYRDCTESGIWPSWSNDITDLTLPRYAASRIEGEINDWHDHHDG